MVSRRAALRGAAAVMAQYMPRVVLARAEAQVFRELRFTATLSNPGLAPLHAQLAWIYMPMRETATQRLERMKVNAPHELLNDALGHCILKLPVAELAPLASKVVSIGAELALRNEPVQSQIPDSQVWLRPERFIETDDGGVRSLALQLRRDTPMQTLTAIYDWVRTNLRYEGYVADDLGAREALARRGGDCTEYACLAVALARVNGIPARMVGGYVSTASTAPRAEEYHNWAEVHVDGVWHVLDAQKGSWAREAEDYIAFRIYRDGVINPVGLAHRFKIEGAMNLRL
jgi:hypothetical protein